EPLLDVLCASFAERALRQVTDSQAIDPQDLVATGRVSTDGIPLLNSLLEILAEDGVVQLSEGQWRWSNPPSSTEPHFPAPQDIWSSLTADYPEYSAVISRAGTAGVRLADRLREQHDVESSFSWIDSCTQEESAAVFSAIHDVVAAAVAQQP